MTPREFDESDARIRPARRTRPRSKDRPAHADAIQALVTTVDRGRTTCITDSGAIVTAMKEEADLIIQRFDLKKIKDFQNISIYE